MSKNGSTSPFRKTIYLVDDEPDITSVIKKELETNGFVVHAFNDPKKAFEEFKMNGKDCTVFLSDIRMPAMNGFQLARQVSQHRPDVSVVLMTSFEVHKNEFDTVLPSTDVAAFIQKPVSQKKLLDTLDALFVEGR
jgi:DNA-binding NtrC family response regulator